MPRADGSCPAAFNRATADGCQLLIPSTFAYNIGNYQRAALQLLRAQSWPCRRPSQGVTVKKIGIIFGMETTFPPALVDKINSMGEAGIQAELATVGEVRMAEPSPLPRHRRPHLARHPLLSRLPEECGALAAPSSSTIPSGGAPTTSSSTSRSATSWASRFRRPCCCRTRSIRRAPPSNPCATCNFPCRGTASSATSAFRRS